jgi:hypothetical protein
MATHGTSQRHNPAPAPARRPRLQVTLGAVALLLMLLGMTGRPAPALAASWLPDVIGSGGAPGDVARGVGCASATFCKAVGTAGRILSWNGSLWNADTSPATERLFGVACVSATFCKVVGEGGTIIFWNGSAWSVDASGTGQHLSDVACVSSSFCKAVGISGVIRTWNGSSWSAEASGTTKILYGVDCVSTSFCKAVGDDGIILSWSGGTWTADSSGVGTLLLDVACVSASFCKAVGGLGVIRSWNGSTWSADTSGAQGNLNAVACLSTTFCKLGTSTKSHIWSYGGGSTWSADTSPDTGPVSDIACVSTSFCKAVTLTAILSLAPPDTTPPDTSITAQPPNPSTSSSATFSFTGSDNVTPTASLTFDCRLDSAGFAACTSPKSYTGLSDGPHTFQVRATDAAGNVDPTPASYTWTVDTTPPDTTITAQPSTPTNNSSATFAFTGTDNLTPTSNLTFECSLDGADFTVCTSSKTYTDLMDGSHTFRVRAKDAAGNVDPTPASFTWVVDRTPPTINCSTTPSQLGPPNHQLVPVSVTVTASDPGGSGVAGYRLLSVTSNEPDNGLGDGDTPNDIQGWTVGVASTSGQLRAERAGGGSGRVYTFRYEARDNAGNTATATCTVTVPRDQSR